MPETPFGTSKAVYPLVLDASSNPTRESHTPMLKYLVCVWYLLLQVPSTEFRSFLAQWHQWLRYTRPLPPTILEQQADFVRQRELKYLVQAADKRWAAKPSVLDKPRMETLQAGGGTQDNGIRAGGADSVEEKVTEESETQKNSPWSVKQGNPGEGWQPEAWAPVTKK